MPNKFTLLVSSVDKAPYQPIHIVKLRVSAPNKIMLLAPPVDKMPNQPILII